MKKADAHRNLLFWFLSVPNLEVLLMFVSQQIVDCFYWIEGN